MSYFCWSKSLTNRWELKSAQTRVQLAQAHNSDTDDILILLPFWSPTTFPVSHSTSPPGGFWFWFSDSIGKAEGKGCRRKKPQANSRPSNTHTISAECFNLALRQHPQRGTEQLCCHIKYLVASFKQVGIQSLKICSSLNQSSSTRSRGFPASAWVRSSQAGENKFKTDFLCECRDSNESCLLSCSLWKAKRPDSWAHFTLH